MVIGIKNKLLFGVKCDPGGNWQGTIEKNGKNSELGRKETDGLYIVWLRQDERVSMKSTPFFAIKTDSPT